MNNLIHSRLIPQRALQGGIKRDRLLNLLSENINKSLILLCSTAGYGKTTLVQNYLNTAVNNYAWFSAHRDIDNPYTFINYLIHSLGYINPEFSSSTSEIVNNYKEKFLHVKKEKAALSDLCRIFINEFCRHFTKDTIIVIDDLGNIGNHEWLNTIFNNIFENIPGNLHFIITTRQVPEFNLGSLLAKRNILKLETGDLTFSETETMELISSIYNIDCSEGESSLLSKKMEGWITGLHLILQAYGKEFTKIKLDKNLIHEDLFNYFTEDIFNNLDENIREFLLSTSMLENFTEELCETIFETDAGKRIIKELQARNIFIQTHADREKNTVYSYQSLFKNFLTSKLSELKSPEDINQVYRKVYSYYLNRNNYIQAIQYLIYANESSKAVPLIIANFQKLYDTGEFGLLWKWFEELDEDIVKQNVLVLYYKSLLTKFYKGDLNTSIVLLDEAILLAETEKDMSSLIKCRISKAGVLLSLGKIPQAIKMLKESNEIQTGVENDSKMLYLTAYAYYQNSQYDDSLLLLDRAIKLLELSALSDALKDIKIDIFNLYGHIYLIKGEYTKSTSYYEYVSQHAHNVIDKYETIFNLILLYSQSGKFEKANDYIEIAEEISEKIPIPIFRITFLLAVQSMKFEFGQYGESISILEEINSIALKLNHKYYIYLSYSLIGDSYYYLNRLSKAEEYYDLAFTYMNEENVLEKVQYSYTKAIQMKKTEINPSIENVLLDAYKYYNDNTFIYNKIQTAYHLADYYLKTGSLQLSKKYLIEALTVSREKEFLAHLQREYMDSKSLFDFALANNIEKNFVKMVIAESLAKHESAWLTKESKDSFKKIAEDLYDINIKVFGTGEITVRGGILAENFWRKKKWKYILIYLFMNAKKELTKDKLIDIFYPEYSLESADNIFHQIMSKFRSLIKTEEFIGDPDSAAKTIKKKGKADALKLLTPVVMYEDKVARLNKDFSFKLDANEFEKYCSLYSLSRNINKKMEYARAAISLYKGEFLGGLYDQWSEEYRTNYRSEFINISEGFIEILFNNQQYSDTLFYTDNLLRHDKLNEKAFEYTIRSYVSQNKYNLARDKYHYMLKVYDKELGEKPLETFSKKIEILLS